MRPQPWHILILVLVVLLLFGAGKLPSLARNVGKSMRIFKSEVEELRGDEKPVDDEDDYDRRDRVARDRRDDRVARDRRDDRVRGDVSDRVHVEDRRDDRYADRDRYADHDRSYDSRDEREPVRATERLDDEYRRD
ncbi:Sec-independent protein translocase subunit TatA [Brachybacterium sp. JHP9]|uniref:Sec-independent protein translocase protein TatA n=1 Tax=Brachybacterium equifaecis TaxID=2910770 RepID=A0ABT0R5B8_9MICO|nr:Sec-independent protein translocase subunit TatA [Brachybacterium equifaecis]MCL6424120.1 Sec-independent protein translocase subunit TatA [Brachybacterium equifaecis]